MFLQKLQKISAKSVFIQHFWHGRATFFSGQTAPAFLRPKDFVKEQLAPQSNIKTITLDVRSPEQYEKGHIKGGLNLYDMFSYLQEDSTPKGMIKMQDHFREKLGEIGISGDTNEHVVVYEQGANHLYPISCRSFFLLKYLGHPNVSVLTGGMNAYLDTLSKLEYNPNDWIEKGPVDGNEKRKRKFIGKVDDTWMSNRNELCDVIANYRNDEVHILDVRDKEEWLGESSATRAYGSDFCPRKGRLPNAKWIEWYEFMEKGEPKSKEQIDEMMQQRLGLEDKDEPIIVYCLKGARSSKVWLILQECGYTNAKNYFGSWNEWSRDFNLPIDSSILSSTHAHGQKTN